MGVDWPAMRIFVSYSHLDKSFVKRLQEDLSQQGLDIRLASDALRPGYPITDKIVEEITQADAFIIVLSRKSANSTWLNYEVAAAISAQSKGSLRAIIPIITEKGTEIPFIVKDREYLDFSDSRDYSKSRASLVQHLKTISSKTPEQVAKLLKLQMDVVLSTQMALKAEQAAYRRQSLAMNSRMDTIGFAGAIATMVLTLLFVIFQMPPFRWWLLAGIVLSFGTVVFYFVWVSKQARKLTRIEDRSRKRE